MILPKDDGELELALHPVGGVATHGAELALYPGQPRPRGAGGSAARTSNSAKFALKCPPPPPRLSDLRGDRDPASSLRAYARPGRARRRGPRARGRRAALGGEGLAHVVAGPRSEARASRTRCCRTDRLRSHHGGEVVQVGGDPSRGEVVQVGGKVDQAGGHDVGAGGQR
jgi:hypothetical protein